MKQPQQRQQQQQQQLQQQQLHTAIKVQKYHTNAAICLCVYLVCLGLCGCVLCDEAAGRYLSTEILSLCCWAQYTVG